ncbi:MAG: hypothetical protein Q6356_007775, partial [Candidatus Wukongarchaeota archaeon]|nr:hypothetical protein [Candidatus Wukongarchaeota archaeon]
MEEKKRKKNGLWETTEPRYKRFLRYKSVQKWLKDILSEKTKRNYMYLFYKFLRSAQKNPKSLLKLDDKELKETIEKYLNKKLEEERRGMVAHTFTVIKSFLASQNRILEWSKNEKRKYSRIGYTRVAKQHVPTKEEIYAMADVASTPRNRAI